MVNSKRMSKSKVAMIALAILLVLSLVLTATGAWFTDNDSASASKEYTWGTVHIEAAGGYTEHFDITPGQDEDQLVMPGDTLDFSGNVSNEGTVAVYVFVADLGSLTVAGGERTAVAYGAGWTAGTGTMAGYHYCQLAVGAESDEITYTITLNAVEDYGDGSNLTYMGQQLEIASVTLNFYAVQAANLDTAAEAFAQLNIA